MYLLSAMSIALNYTVIKEIASSYDLMLIFTILSGIGALILILEYFTKIPRTIWIRFVTPSDSRALIGYDKYFTEEEVEKFNRPYVNRIEKDKERDAIGEVKEFLESSHQVLIISGESGVGKTRLAIEVSKVVNSKFKFWKKCLFINLRQYKKAEDIREKLDKQLTKNITVIFDDYQYNMDVFDEVKNLTLKRKSNLIITTRPVFVDGLKRNIGQAAVDTIALRRISVEGILSEIEDEETKKSIIKISEGIPSIALLALDYIKKYPDKNRISFFHGLTSMTDFFDKIIDDFEKQSNKEFLKFLAGGALIGGITKIPEKFEDNIRLFVKTGHIIKKDESYWLTPDILSDYLINHVFFERIISEKYFTKLGKANNNEHILDIMNTVVRLNDGSKIYEEAVKILFTSLDATQKIKRIKIGISAYNGFGNIKLVTENLGEFWNDYKVLDNPYDLFDLGSFLFDISKLDEAKNCLESANRLFNEKNEKRGISSTLHQIAMIHQDKGEYDEALDKYNQSLEINEKLGDQRGMAITNAQIGVFHRNMGEIPESIACFVNANKIFKGIGDRPNHSKTLSYVMATVDLIDETHITSKASTLIPLIKEVSLIFSEMDDEGNTVKMNGLISRLQASSGEIGN